MRRVLRPASHVLALGLLLTLTVMVAAANAAPKGVVDVIGVGDFASNSPRGVAVHNASGDVYVADGTGHRVRRYAADGTFLSQIGSGTAANTKGNFSQPNGVAVDQATGSVWVTDASNFRVQRFDAPDAFGTNPFSIALGWDVVTGPPTTFEVCGAADTCKQGISGSGDGQFASLGAPAFDAATGAVYVAELANRRIQRFDAATGAYEAKFGSAALFGTNSPARIAVDATGVVYAVDAGNNRVMRCISLGGAPETFSCSAFASAHLSGNNPFAVAVDQDSGHVYVARRKDEAATGTVNDDPIYVVQLEPDGDLVETHGVGAGITSNTQPTSFNQQASLAVNSLTDALYLSVPNTNNAARRAVVVLGGIAGAPIAALTSISAVTSDGATIDGVVNPNGAPTGYRVEYRTGPNVAWSGVPATPADLGNGTTDVPVTQTLTGLEPNRTYEVRIVATRSWGPDIAATPIQTFTTGALAPSVANTRATVSSTAAALSGDLDANNLPTDYWFEYGPTAAYGSSTPVRDGGDEGTAKRVLEVIEGLQPNTTYHYRLVAESAEGRSESPDATFTTRPADPTPGGRSYELVTPPGSVSDVRWYNGGERPSTPSGNTVCYGSSLPLDDSYAVGGTQVEDIACSHRRASGWETEGVARPVGEAPVPASMLGAQMRWISDDGRRKVYHTDFKGIVPERPLLDPNGDSQPEGYLRADGVTHWVTPVTPITMGARQPAAASADLTRILFEDRATSTVYEWTPAGTNVVSVDGSGNTVPGSLSMGGSSFNGAGFFALPGTISRDGTRIFFEADQILAGEDGPGGSVYIREGGQTRLVSPRRGPAGAINVDFAGASDDGEVVYLFAGGALTNDPTAPGAAIYRYTLSTDQLELVEDGLQFSFDRVLAVSSDGSTVFFRGTNVLSGTDGTSLYVARDGQATERVIGLAANDSGNSDAGQHRVATPNHTLRALRVTPDGSVAVFRAEADTPGIVGVYRWTDAGGLETISVDGDGNKVPAMLGNAARNSFPANRNAGRGMSDDGSTVFFETTEALVPNDVNGDVDVYEWRAGDIRLITPGRFAGDARYLDNSADGSTVFFTTYERITPNGDNDTARDVYNARVGTVFPDLPRDPVGDPPPPKGPSAPPAGPTIGSGQERPGEQATPPLVIERVLGLRKPSSSVLRSLARTGSARVPVTVRGGGRVTVTLTARMNGKARTVAKGSRRVAKRGRVTVRVPVRLSRQARRRLASGRGLRLQISVSAPGAQRKRVAVFVRSASAGASNDRSKQG